MAPSGPPQPSGYDQLNRRRNLITRPIKDSQPNRYRTQERLVPWDTPGSASTY
ncbi:hypothetical protein HMPREF0742_01331 [Rothia aeria F0184]|uniref:Uncharacterized protein n=1 Tax=Rothia aeria F0184 TaxID=888019 RepID=U7V3J4_9MICC|nr:hypothetical protein HMPREF0742_01331 [Rothia aeria F0184]